jgi:vacuolar-type H+-ATPase subunit H
MATTTTKAHPKRAEKGPADYLSDALDDLERASEKAGGEVADRIEEARKRIGEARDDLSERGEDQLKQWREQLTDAADDVLRELGRVAVRSQRSDDALTELAKEIDRRKAELAK